MENDPLSFEPEGPRASLGRAVRALRGMRGLSRRELAERADLSYSYLSEIETGRKQPSANAIQALAQALAVRPSELVAEAERWERERIAEESLEGALASQVADAPLSKPGVSRERSQPYGPDPRGARARQQRWHERPIGSSLPPVVAEIRDEERREFELEEILGELRALLRHASDADRALVLDLARRLAED